MILTTYRPQARTPFIRRRIDTPLAALLDDVLPDFFTAQPIVRNAEGKAVVTAQARFDVVEKADRYEAFIEMPGVTKQDIEVDIDGARVSVKAAAKNEQLSEPLKEGERVLYAERRATVWSRSFELPTEVADDRAEAQYENGVLKLVLPKKEVLQAKRLQVQ